MRFYKLKIILVTSVLIGSLFNTPAQAVVNGSEILDADITKPWVAQIYWAETLSDYGNPRFLCTGSLISEDKILTAAHCAFDTGFYFINLGARTLSSNAQLLEVNAVWRNPRYSDQRLVNDVGLLQLTNPVKNITPIPLASSSMSKSINKLKSYTIYGWGRNQNGVLATYLRTAKLNNQDAVAKKYLSKVGYSSTTMLAAGNYIKSERIYAGSCKGDSGGPLVSTINGVETLIGITSWGIPGPDNFCDLGYPSVFTRVTYFLKDINTGLSTVTQSAKDDNRAVPSYTIRPSIIGSSVVGSVITCDKGQWSANTTSVTFKWTSPSSATSITNQSININEWNAGQTFTCVVTGSSNTISLPVILSVSVPVKPTPTPTPTPTARATPTPTASATPTPTASATPTPTASATPTPTASATPTPTPTVVRDLTSPVVTTDGPAGVSPPGLNFYAQFKATDNVAVTTAKAVLIKNSSEVSTTVCPAHTSLPNFYLCSINLPIDATVDGYSIRFDAFDAAGNKGSGTIAHSTITNHPVYSAGATVTKSGADTISVGDIFTCNTGTWLYTNSNFYPVTCEWVTTSGTYRGTSLTVTSVMLSGATYGVRVILRVNNGAPVTGAWTSWFKVNSNGYEPYSSLDIFATTYSKSP